MFFTKAVDADIELGKIYHENIHIIQISNTYQALHFILVCSIEKPVQMVIHILDLI